jgi:hypothetical protein
VGAGRSVRPIQTWDFVRARWRSCFQDSDMETTCKAKLRGHGFFEPSNRSVGAHRQIGLVDASPAMPTSQGRVRRLSALEVYSTPIPMTEPNGIADLARYPGRGGSRGARNVGAVHGP